jgi:phosphate/sulfate permease
MGMLNLVSLLYLSFVVAFVLGMNDHDNPSGVAAATVRRWLKLLAALVVIGVVVRILSHI